MNKFDFLIIGVLVALVLISVYFYKKNKSKGGCGGCSGCSVSDKCGIEHKNAGKH